MLVYVQAIDVPHKVVLSKREFRRALLKANMTSTSNRLGMLPLFTGMRVRLTAKISGAQWARSFILEILKTTTGDVRAAMWRRRVGMSGCDACPLPCT